MILKSVRQYELKDGIQSVQYVRTHGYLHAL